MTATVGIMRRGVSKVLASQKECFPNRISTTTHNGAPYMEGKMREFRVLMIDDEEDFVKTLAERMLMRDLDSEVALSGEAALQAVEEQAPDVMVLDLKMPGIDGMEVLRRVRRAYPQVQVVILTGHGSGKDEREARRLGAFAYLQKPVDIEKLTVTLKNAYKEKMEDAMMAATFAETGELQRARQIVDEEQKVK